MTRRAPRAFAGACLIAVALAACGTSPPSTAPPTSSATSSGPACPPAGAPLQLPATSEPAGVAAVTQAATRDLSGPAGAQTTVTETLSAVTVLGGPCGAMTGAGSFDAATGDGALALKPQRATATSVSTDGYTVVYTAAAAYVRMPVSQTRALPAGRSWVAAPFQVANTPAYTQSLSVRRLFLQLLTANPRLILSELAAGVQGAASAGMTTVDGTAATEYRVNMNRESAYALLSGAFTYRGPYTLSVSLPTAVEVAVDSSGALVQVTMATPAANLGTVTMTFAAPGAATGNSSAALPAAVVPAPTATVELNALLKIAEGKGNEGGEGGGEGAGS